ncbi:MAG: 2-C-methyl-D-erythritol 4-phosphate cytidylyltransferase [Rhodothermales bacterium]|nr:2-C-methyl-D-erythritol 4-phosphate cytidylyltransferase [Rhodothermales bacterium]
MPRRSKTRSEVAVLIPAAGEGTRLGGHRKQFRRLGGQPLLVQTLRMFETHGEVDHLLLAAPADAVAALDAELRSSGLTKLLAVIEGGETRQASVRAALAAVPAAVEVVLVHDAVRPFLEPERLSAVIGAVREYGAAALAIPAVDTLRKGQGGRFGETVPREGLLRMQTPQGFRKDWFEAAHTQAAADGYTATDDVDLVQRLGRPVQIVPGSPRNMKITTPGDWELAQILWEHWSPVGLVAE